VTLFLDADPDTDAVRARYQLGGEPAQTMGRVNLPAAWLDFPSAAGLITTKAGSANQVVSFVFDEFGIRAGTPVAAAPGDDFVPAPKEGETVIRNGAVCKAVPARSTNTDKGKIRLSVQQLLINQRISQAAVRRSNAVQERLVGKFRSDDLCGGAFTAQHFHTGIKVGTGSTHELDPASPRPIETGRRTSEPAGGSSGVRLSAEQLLINQRISQAAVRRSNALLKRLQDGLTGGDIVNGAITAGKLAAGLRITVAGKSPNVLPPSKTIIAPASRNPGARVTLSVAQLRINQRIAQAAVRRSNALIDLLESGLTGAEFRKKSITRVDLAAALIPKKP
jgi:hypothetical protein